MKLFTRLFSCPGISIAAVFFLLFLLGSIAYAGTFESSDWTQEPTYLGKTSQKLGFGFLNLTAGWTAFFYEPFKDQNFFVGLAKGVGYTFTNTVGGVLHAATFPIPVDIPLPNGGIAYEYKK
jgi:hypothetical protein